ncbi:NAD(P)H-dependent flavin oxidoreductase YrpB (nitropropane dioxygenase family) [Mobilisporobacter senegalensis]|uniref:Probable nitronate monooxygenase n=1 Tax=Mobilisporobacter senegalensis TaxID=1329262 RepID=A0A3N1XKA9_9FIRM|nr:nitronate monooxygenase family protein [Mobilisporobacter senegalensis]ROR27160.1 NAD(P)H-dependent flavin oxidoreductase YrpB (nitropropane dioxygenase family) [Mobilisporobacter senegalensis]
MKLKPLVIGELTARLPIIQGGMGVGISLSSLAGAVAAEGGIGIISTAQIGFKEEDFDKKPLEANLRAIGKHIKRARELAPKGIIGVNIMVATKNYGKYVKEAVSNGIDLIISGAGLPLDLPALAGKTKTKLIPIVSSVKAANIILKMWDKKHGVYPDAFVVEGPKAGGHLGFHLEQLENIEELNYDQEIKDIIKLAKEWEEQKNCSIPVIVAGGIRNREDIDYYMNLGAAGVQIASKFVTTKECDAHINYKNAYLNAKEEDIMIVKSPVGMPGRAIRNKFMEKASLEKIPVTSCHSCLEHCNQRDIPYCITDALINAAKGHVDDALLFCGANAFEQNEIKTVKEVMDELTRDE